MSLLVEGRCRAAENEQRDRAWLAWTTAALGRAKTMPALADLLKQPDQKRGAKPMTADQMLTMARMWTAVTADKRKGKA